MLTGTEKNQKKQNPETMCSLTWAPGGSSWNLGFFGLFQYLSAKSNITTFKCWFFSVPVSKIQHYNLQMFVFSVPVSIIQHYNLQMLFFGFRYLSATCNSCSHLKEPEAHISNTDSKLKAKTIDIAISLCCKIPQKK